MNDIFRADWIRARKNLKNNAVSFLRTFTVRGDVKAASVSITAHGVFRAKIGNVPVGDDVLAPGWTVYDKRLQYMTYDVTPLVKPGENLIEVTVGRGWFFHKTKEWALGPLQPDEAALIAALTVEFADGSTQTVLTDGDWFTRPSRTVYNDMYNGETRDLSRKKGELSPAVTVNAPKNVLIPAEGEKITEHERFVGKELIVTPKGEKVIDFGQEVTGYVQFSAAAPAGTEIRLKHFEVLDADGNVYTANLRSAEAAFTVIAGDKPFTVKPHYTFYGFRYVHVTGLEEVDPAAFTAIAVHSDMRRTGFFESGNALLDQFVHNVVWGQKGNFLDVPTDCPQRDERLGWTGDAEVFSRTAAILFDVRTFFNKWLNDLRADQRADGAIPHVCPLPWERKDGAYGSPAWADAAVIVPWETYLAYGDKCFLRRHLPLMRGWVDYMLGVCRKKGEKTGEEFGHPWTADGFGDWLSLDKENVDDAQGKTDKGLIATAYLAKDLEILADAYRVLGLDPSYYEAARLSAVDFFRREYMDGGRMKQQTQTAAVLALTFGLTDKPDVTAKQLIENVKAHGRLTTGFIGSTYLLDALTAAGADELAVDLLLKTDYPSWLYPVTMGATTIWERWNGINPDRTFSDAGMNSFNHYAYGSVFAWMFRRLAGVRPAAPGYRAVTFAPAPDARLPHISACIDALPGKVGIEYDKTETGWRFRFTVPEGVEAKAELFGETLPLASGETVIER
ncbi:MAG: family 78 glycoside hydrolase catalytic domain [Clostridia bacterium]|nr:family 78 glycoside hydrolase catalytic domain [Clostridia bacterium]